MAKTFHYLKIGLGVVLAFVGVKMLLAHTAYEIDTLISLGVVAGILILFIVASLLRPARPLVFTDTEPCGVGGQGDGRPVAGPINTKGNL